MKCFFLFSFFIVFFSSCNCNHEGNGFVYDKIKQTPIENARVDIISVVPGKDTMSPAVFTDSKGYFSYKHNSCKDLVTIYKANYIGHTTKDMDGDTIYLEYLEGN